MRVPTYMSPTSFQQFYKDEEEYYMKYLAENRPPRMPQTKPMAVGSSFDAYIKSYLHEKLFGAGDPKFELTTLFEAQVEEQNRDFALIAGKDCFDQYIKHGAAADMMLELELADSDPQFEFRIEGKVVHEGVIDGINFLGLPDVYFHRRDGEAVIFDWKVNGYCSKSNTSPKPGFINVRGPVGTRGINAAHKDAQPMLVDGMMINVATTMEAVDEKWAVQEAVYGWLLGEKVGAQFVVGIDQLAVGANPDYENFDTKPAIRIARHRCRISRGFQEETYARAVWVNTVVQSGWIFRGMSEEDSHARQTMLDERHLAYGDSDDPKEAWFSKATRSHGGNY